MIRRAGLCFSFILVACQPSDHASTDPASATAPSAFTDSSLCDIESTPIPAIQGSGATSPLLGRTVVARGVVTQAQTGVGIYLESEVPEVPARASRALFVASEELANSASEGDLLAANGIVSELGDGPDTLTSLSEIHAWAVCDTGRDLPRTNARLPLPLHEREALEAMRVFIQQPLTISDVHDIRENEVTVSAMGLPGAPTEVGRPGPEALSQRQKIRDWSINIRHPSLSLLEPLHTAHAGAKVSALGGVLGNVDGSQILLAQEAIKPIPEPRIDWLKREEGDLRIASFNIYSYFNGDGHGGGFPAERGARSLEEFQRQTAGIVAAIGQMQPDILAVIEVENDGFGPDSAIESLRKALSESFGVDFAVAQPAEDRVGGDIIAVGLLYRSDRVAAIGVAHQLNSGVFAVDNRAPLAQVFEYGKTGTRLLVVANHFKSKSFCPGSGPDADQGDGQACWNATRTAASRGLNDWVERLVGETGVERYILLGDFNAYRMEDPVTTILEHGGIELVEHKSSRPLYSYIYRGMAGTLDYAFASRNLLDNTVHAFIWHINAAFPYSEKPSVAWLRSSDHDPVIVDFRFSQSDTSH